MNVFELDNGTYGFDELARAVDLARQTGRGLRIAANAGSLQVAIGQMMWSLPIAEIPADVDGRKITDYVAVGAIADIMNRPEGWSPDMNNEIADVVRLTGRKVD